MPSKLGDVNGAITPLDAVGVLQSVVGERSVDARTQLACDVSADAVC